MSSDPSKGSEPSVCASCGETFGCGAKLEGCWCAEVALSEVATAAIAKEYDDCLCPKCLSSFARQPAMKLTYPDGSVEIVRDAARVDTTNYHEGMFDFYDARGNLLKQVAMGSGVNWDDVSEA